MADLHLDALRPGDRVLLDDRAIRVAAVERFRGIFGQPRVRVLLDDPLASERVLEADAERRIRVAHTDDPTESDMPDQKPSVILGDGNAFAILARCDRAARGAGWSAERRDAFRAEATRGDYDHLLGTVMRYFAVGLEEEYCADCGEPLGDEDRAETRRGIIHAGCIGDDEVA